VTPFAFGLGLWAPVGGQYTRPAQALRAAGARPLRPAWAGLDAGLLQGEVAGALARLSGAGVDPALVQRLAAAQYEVGAVPPGDLGLAFATEGRVVLSPDAAGYGWFVDATPLRDEEFQPGAAGSPLVALPGSHATGRMDLLTTVLHEMGHLAGLPDRDAGASGADLMADALAPGVRRTEALDRVFSGADQ
jgi:hypothetical protein